LLLLRYCNPVAGFGRITTHLAVRRSVSPYHFPPGNLIPVRAAVAAIRSQAAAAIANMTKALQFLIDNLAAARGGTDDNESLADLIITFFCGICLEQNLGPDRARITKKIDAFMRLIRAI
jgi:hypothetical protein